MTRTMMTGIQAALLAVAASAALVACGGGGDGGVAPAPATGTLRVALTDAPNCRVGNDDLDKVYVTVERVRVHQIVGRRAVRRRLDRHRHQSGRGRSTCST